jgi:signal peptidase II
MIEQQETLEAPQKPSRQAVTLVWALVAAVWLLLDQVTKLVAVATLEGRRGIDLRVLDLRVIRNPGGAFGIPGLFPGLFVLVTVVVVTLVVRALPRTDRLSLAVAYGLVTGGALGNAADRVFRSPGFPSGHVVDFVDLRWWPVFNAADVGICVGAALIAWILTKAEREEAASAGAPAPDA